MVRWEEEALKEGPIEEANLEDECQYLPISIRPYLQGDTRLIGASVESFWSTIISSSGWKIESSSSNKASDVSTVFQSEIFSSETFSSSQIAWEAGTGVNGVYKEDLHSVNETFDNVPRLHRLLCPYIPLPSAEKRPLRRRSGEKDQYPILSCGVTRPLDMGLHWESDFSSGGAVSMFCGTEGGRSVCWGGG